MIEERDCQGEAKLISAVLEQAVYEAQGYSKSDITLKARQFLSTKNIVFRKFCYMLNIDPDWLCDGIWRKINNKQRDKNVT